MKDENVIVVENPLAKYYLTILRDRNTSPKLFREYVRKLGFILGYEASRYIKWKNTFVETPLARAEGIKPIKPVIVVGILGASIPLIQGIWDAIPWAGLGLVAARRIESEYEVEIEVYYERLPDDLSPYTVLIADPMLATGKTIVNTIELLKKRNAKEIVVLTIIASKYGVEYVHGREKNVPIITITIDPFLNDRFFIVPGLGDAGDRGLGSDVSW
ncbi:MAG: uracil phosphoribosyltransferase [Desulfurococcales archaeon ex4484_58]|nr:MAG: uracil phosphoribosyltransferase [Desulfurococcales archaeon ex4484_58]